MESAGAQRWHLAGVSQRILQHTHKYTLLLTLSIKVPHEPWGLLWSQMLCHLAELWSRFIGTSQSSRLECYAFNFHPFISIPIFFHHCSGSQCCLSEGRLRPWRAASFIKAHINKLTAAGIKCYMCHTCRFWEEDWRFRLQRSFSSSLSRPCQWTTLDFVHKPGHLIHPFLHCFTRGPEDPP